MDYLGEVVDSSSVLVWCLGQFERDGQTNRTFLALLPFIKLFQEIITSVLYRSVATELCTTRAS